MTLSENKKWYKNERLSKEITQQANEKIIANQANTENH
jgi:hypothetical protein